MIEVKTLLINGRELNRNIFRQIPEICYQQVILESYSNSAGTRTTYEIIGKVLYPELVKKNPRYLFHFLCKKGNELYRSACYERWNLEEGLYWRIPIKSLCGEGKDLIYESSIDYESWEWCDGIGRNPNNTRYIIKEIRCLSNEFAFEDIPQIYLRA